MIHTNQSVHQLHNTDLISMLSIAISLRISIGANKESVPYFTQMKHGFIFPAMSTGGRIMVQ